MDAGERGTEKRAMGVEEARRAISYRYGGKRQETGTGMVRGPHTGPEGEREKVAVTGNATLLAFLGTFVLCD